MSKRGQPISLGVDLFNPAGAVAGTAAVPHESATATDQSPTAPEPSPRNRKPESLPVPTPDPQAASDAWTWSGAERMGSHRYPVELLDRLDERTRELDLPIGLTLAAALALVLEFTDRDLEKLVRGRAARARQAGAQVAYRRSGASAVGRRRTGAGR